MPTPCVLTQGNSRKVCKDPSGISEILITEFSNINVLTIAAGVVTAFTLLTGKRFWRYIQPAESADWKQSATSSAANAAYRYGLEVNFSTRGIATADQEENGLLIQNTLVVMTKHNDGTYWLLGHEYGMDVATIGTESGMALGDFAGDKIQLTGVATLKAKRVTTSLIAVLIAPAV